MNVKYAGIRGSIHGEKKDKSPAKKAAGYVIVSSNIKILSVARHPSMIWMSQVTAPAAQPKAHDHGHRAGAKCMPGVRTHVLT